MASVGFGMLSLLTWNSIGAGVVLGLGAGLAPSPHTIIACDLRQRCARSARHFCIGGLGADAIFALSAAQLSPVIGHYISIEVLWWVALGHAILLLLGVLRFSSLVLPKSLPASIAGLGVQLFNPNPWVFWLTQGAIFSQKDGYILFCLSFLAVVFFTKLGVVEFFGKKIKQNSQLRGLFPALQILLLLISGPRLGE